MHISDELAVCIAEVLESNHSLQILNIRSDHYYLGNAGFDRIAKSLKSNTTLRELYFLCNYGEAAVNKKIQTIQRIRQKKGLHPAVYIGM